MKKIIFISGIIFFLIACGKEDKQAKLQKLINERDKLNEKIADLKKEITSGGSIQAVPVDVSLMEIKRAEFDHYVEVQGKVDGEDNITVTAKAIGVVSGIYAKEGETVKAGQVLAELDAQVQKQALEELKTQLAFATNVYEKQKSLWDQKIGSEIQYLTAKNNKEALEKKLSTTQEQIALCSIKSPISGTVEEVSLKIGQAIQPGVTAFRVVNFSRIKIMAEVAEAYSNNISDGDKVMIYFPDIDKEITTNLSFTSKFINPVNRTFTVEARMDNSQYNFRANMIAILKVNDFKAKDAIAVPVNLIQESMDGKYVYMAKDENGKTVAVRQVVTTGSSYNGLYEIKTGLKEGDRLISSGYQMLKEGQLLNIKKSE